MPEISLLQPLTQFPLNQIYAIIRGEITPWPQSADPHQGEGNLLIYPVAYMRLSLDQIELQAVLPQAACLLMYITETNHLCLCIYDQSFQPGEDPPDPIWRMCLEQLPAGVFEKATQLAGLFDQHMTPTTSKAEYIYVLLRKLLENRNTLQSFAVAPVNTLQHVMNLFNPQPGNPIITHHQIPC